MNLFSKRISKGDPAAFAEIYQDLGDKLFRYAYSRLGTSADAADVVQNIFVRLVKSHRSLAKAKNLNGYVFAVARTELVRWIEKRNKDEVGSHQVEPPQLARCEFRQIESIEWVGKVLSELETIDAEIVRLKVMSELTFKEVSLVLELNENNVATRYRRAMIRLNEKLSAAAEAKQ